MGHLVDISPPLGMGFYIDECTMRNGTASAMTEGNVYCTDESQVDTTSRLFTKVKALAAGAASEARAGMICICMRDTGVDLDGLFRYAGPVRAKVQIPVAASISVGAQLEATPGQEYLTVAAGVGSTGNFKVVAKSNEAVTGTAGTFVLLNVTMNGIDGFSSQGT